MKETAADYLFQSPNTGLVAFTKKNYKKHIPRHPAIAGKEGLLNIGEALLNPHVITEYTQNANGSQPSRECRIFYKIVKRRLTGGGKVVLDYWQVIVINNILYKRWEVATAIYEESSPEYTMINSRVETILQDYRTI